MELHLRRVAVAAVHFELEEAVHHVRAHLAAEGVVEGVHVVGDVMLDAFERYAELAARGARQPELDLRGRYALAPV